MNRKLELFVIGLLGLTSHSLQAKEKVCTNDAPEEVNKLVEKLKKCIDIGTRKISAVKEGDSEVESVSAQLCEKAKSIEGCEGQDIDLASCLEESLFKSYSLTELGLYSEASTARRDLIDRETPNECRKLAENEFVKKTKDCSESLTASGLNLMNHWAICLADSNKYSSKSESAYNLCAKIQGVEETVSCAGDTSDCAIKYEEALFSEVDTPGELKLFSYLDIVNRKKQSKETAYHCEAAAISFHQSILYRR